jgi:integrase/recombinase XerD
MARPAERPYTDVADPRGLFAMRLRFLDAMAIKGFSMQTIATRRSRLDLFIEWCGARGVARPDDVTKPVLERYQRTLFLMRQKSGKPLSFQAQVGRLVAVKMFFRWLTRENFLPANPAADLELPRAPRRLPRAVLTIDEVERVMAQPDLTDPLGVRDRAVLETFYSTGIRRGELLALCVHDLDVDRRTVLVREGKGKKDRIIPIGERALAWVEKYVDEVRPSLVGVRDEGFLFLSSSGGPMTGVTLSPRVRKYIEEGSGKSGSCHLFRHTMATLMLEGGADIRFIQAMLGHALLTTTEVYTRVSVLKLQEIHAATHPGSKITRNSRTQATDDDGGLLPTAEDLLADLDEEAIEEADARDI